MRLSTRSSLVGALVVVLSGLATTANGATSTPGTPRAVHAVGGNASAHVTWMKPASTGAAPITKYVVASSPAGHSCTATVPNCTVKGLKNGVKYRFNVTAFNRFGAGARSVWSNVVTPTAVTSHRRVLVVTPSKGLHNGQTVTVTGSGFTPKDAIYIVECLANAKGQSGCNLPTSIPTPVTVSPTGVLPATTFTETTGKVGNGTCGTTATNASSCAISAGNATGSDSAQAIITFKP